MTRPRRAAATAAAATSPPLPPKRSRKNQKETDKKDEEPRKRSRRNSKAEPEEPKVEEEAPAPRVAKSSRSNSGNSESPLLVFAHGAGANSSHEFMVRYVGVDIVNVPFTLCFSVYLFLHRWSMLLLLNRGRIVDVAEGTVIPVTIIGKFGGGRQPCKHSVFVAIENGVSLYSLTVREVLKRLSS